MNLHEIKYRDLTNTKKIKTLKDVTNAAKSHGYNLSKPRNTVGDHYEVDLIHQKSGEKVKPNTGGSIGGSRNSGDRVDTTLVNKVGTSIRQDRARRGGIDKTEKAKARRREEAKRNLERKRRDWNPFTRGKKPTKTFESFMSNYYD